jgi:superfamily II DNA or RNA helicase
MLKSNVIWPDSRRFKSRSEWEPIGFFSEALCNATQFDLKLGFFSSAAINVLADSFAAFLYNGGRMRMIINDILSEEDKDAIVHGQANELVNGTFDLNDIERLRDTLSERDIHFFECLAWLIQNKRLEVKIITPKGGYGISHFKCGLFSDGLNKVAFDGSCNFSRTALVDNSESITAFCDWDGGKDIFKITDIEKDFNSTFEGNDETVDYVDATDIQSRIESTFRGKSIQKLLEDEEELIQKSLKKSLPISITYALNRAKVKVRTMIKRIKEEHPEDKVMLQIEPSFPYGEPRDYQKQAYENWKLNKQKGLFAMATGTGKTLTSLNCLLNIYKKFGFYKAMILVPTITLVDQWEEECRKFHFDRIVKVCSKNHNWKNDLGRIKSQEDFNLSGKEPSYVIIATYASFAREQIFYELVDFNSKVNKQLLLIADEAHNMGSGSILNRLDNVKFLRRIGLSATPERQFDEAGNRELMRFFGAEEKYTFEYTMREAIDNGYLCRYYYYPHIVNLNAEEYDQYMEISLKLAKMFNVESNSFTKDDDILMRLLLKRKRIIHKAANKLGVFEQILKERYEEKGNLKYTLVYVPEGVRPDATGDLFEHEETLPDDDEMNHLIDSYTRVIQEISPVTTVKKFMSGVKERNEILKEFASGELEVLTSMKCLDEGVDVPRSELAIFCASTGNPRQFIQRRGRILRTHPDKHFAIIHDLVVVPMVDAPIECYKLERNLVKGEIKRVRDFATLSENADYAYNELDSVLNYYNIPLF